MALTQEQIDNAGLDTITLGEVVNGPAGLNGTGKAITRTGAQIKTLAKIEEEGEARITALQASTLQAELAADRAEMSAAIAEALFAAPYDTVPAGEAGTAEGEHFAVDNGDGTVTVYERTAGGSSARWSLATTAALASPDGAGMVGWENRNLALWLEDQPVNILDKGADREGIDDSTTALLLARDTGRNIIVPPGNYKKTGVGGVLLFPGQEVIGPGGTTHRTEGGARIFNDTVGGGIFWYDEDTSTGTVKMPSISGLTLQADYPVKFNNEQTAVIFDGSAVPHLLGGGVKHCHFRARASGVGLGASLSKCFDWFIEDCEFYDFDINVLLNGSDLGRLEHSRLWYAKSYHILELSASTYGSQNEIRHNDILLASDPGCMFFKSNAVHVRFYNNYLEQSSKGAGACTGFIDISTVALPSYAGNTPLAQRGSVVVEDNRIDGHHRASDFVYRVEPAGRTYVSVRDVGTSGTHPTAPTLLICDDTGANIDEVPFLYNTQNPACFHFQGAKFGKWDGFKSNTQRSLRVDGTNLFMTSYARLSANGINDVLRAKGKYIVMKAGYTAVEVLNIAIPQLLETVEAGKTYIVNVTARCSGTEQLRFGRFADGSAPSLNTTPVLTSKFQTYSTEITFSSVPTTSAGITIRPAANTTDDIEIEYIEVRPKYDREYPVTAYTTAVDFDIGATAGFVDVMARNDGSTFFSRKRYAIIYGALVQIANAETDAGTISVSATLSGTTVTATVTGSAGSKNLAIGHVLP